MVAEVFLQMLPSLRAMEKYSSNFDTASKALHSLEEGAQGWWSKDPLQMWLRETSARISRPLRALLILPVQRLPPPRARARVIPDCHPSAERAENK